MLHTLYTLTCIFIHIVLTSGNGDFWFVTDFHVDQNYSRTGNPDNLCHQDKITFPDVGRYGNFLCDSPQSLINASIASMKQIQPNPDFIIWTGDNLPHTEIIEPDWEVVFKAIDNITTLLAVAFPKTPIFPCIGNHDTFPANLLLPNGSSNAIYEGYLVKGGWNKLLPEDTWSTFHQGGFYSQVIKPGLRLISLNTILWYTPNLYTAELEDPANQFQWLKDTLNGSLLSSEKVYIMGHVPPGFYNRVLLDKKSDPTFHPHCLETYLQILNQYSKIIVGQMYGHLHMDMFQLFQYNTGTFESSSILASSVTPWHFIDKDNSSLPVNPSIRLMHFSEKDFSLLDYDQYYMNLSKVNDMNITNGDQLNLYEPLYKFTEFYGVPDLSTKSLVKVYEMMKENQTVFDKFYRVLTAGKESVGCGRHCKVAQLCAISCITSDEYDQCMETIKETNFLNTIFPATINVNVVLTVVIAISIVVLIASYVIYQRYYKRKTRKAINRVEYEPFTNF